MRREQGRMERGRQARGVNRWSRKVGIEGRDIEQWNKKLLTTSFF